MSSVGDSPAFGLSLVNTRTTFQRTRDARFFTGRVLSMRSTFMAISCPQGTEFLAGDRFHFQIFGSGHEGHLMARFEYTAPSTEAQHKFVFRIESEIEIRSTRQEARFLMRGLYADVECHDERVQAVRVYDVSENGFSLTCPRHLRKGDVVSVDLLEEKGTIALSAEVRYCLKDKDLPSTYRIGFLVKSLDRVSSVRWKALHKRMVAESRYRPDELPSAA